MSLQLGVCPACNGRKRRDAHGVSYKHVLAGYDQISDTLPCHNCGAQYMYGEPSGEVRLRPDGTACLHEYHGATVGRCLTRYTCAHCADSYQIDSGD